MNLFIALAAAGSSHIIDVYGVLKRFITSSACYSELILCALQSCQRRGGGERGGVGNLCLQS